MFKRMWIMTSLLIVALMITAKSPVAGEEKLLNINTASVAELTALKGIGAAKAKAVVEHREKRGPFKSVDSLTDVPGIGPKLLETIRPQVTVGVASAGAAPASAAASAPVATKQ